MYRRFIVLLVILGLAVPASGQIDSGTPVTGLGGGSYSDAHTKAAKAYRQGLKFRQRAEKATEAAEREAFHKQALTKFYESAGWVENFDARLAMGEVHLALGQKAQAAQACHVAKFLKPKNEKAKECYAAATGEAVAAEAQAGDGS